jgi:hypothetical protein
MNKLLKRFLLFFIISSLITIPSVMAAKPFCGDGRCKGRENSLNCPEDCGCVPYPETCNNLDDNCNDLVDENLFQQCGVTDVGACEYGTQTCSAGVWGACVGNIDPSPEVCEGSIDENCNGLVDEGCDCTDGQTQQCGIDVGECEYGLQTCSGGVWGPCVGEIPPTTETCNNLDDDCNGVIDNGLVQVCGVSDVGACQYGISTCSAGIWGSCVGNIDPTTEVCNGIDDDCNTIIDDNFDQDDCVEKCTFDWTGNGGNLNCCGDDAGEDNPFEVVEITSDGNDNDCDGIVDESGIPATQSADSVLHLGDTGYAYLDDADVTDLDYSKDFSVEVLARIEAFQSGGRYGTFIQKGGVPYLASSPGFSIGTETGNEESFGKYMKFKIGDGTNHVVTSYTSKPYQGDAYAVMTWDAVNKEMDVYINGQYIETKANTAIVPSNIQNIGQLRMGKISFLLRRDIFMARLWNRKISSTDVINLWDNYDINGQHQLPPGFDSTDLHSEWLMGETSDATGGLGTTHIKDTAGNNYLLLTDGAKIYKGDGALTMIYPNDGAVNIDKSVILKAGGGIATLGGAVKPLQYYFQIDEVNTFNSANLKESGWIKHYGRYKPVLKPNTQYYWKVKVRDSDSTPAESSYTSIRSFTTEGTTNWYVRNLVDSDIAQDALKNPIIDTGVYGTQDGSSYANAFNGLAGIKWGEGGVEAGDTLYVCGVHLYNSYYNYWAPPTSARIKESGFSDEYPITITTNCPEEPGQIWGAGKVMGTTVTWTGPDANGVYSTSDISNAAVEFDGSNYIWLDKEFSTTWAGHPGASYTTGGVTYVKTSDLSNPTGKIYSDFTYDFLFDMGRSSFIKFKNYRSYHSIVIKDSKGSSISNLDVSKNITFENCEIAYYDGGLISLSEGMDNWIVRNCDLHDMENGIYTHTPGHVYNLLVENNRIYNTGPPNYGTSDCHAIGVQNGANHIFQNNTIWNTGGTAIEFWAGTHTMKNMTVRNNFIKDTHTNCSTGGQGIGISGTNTDSWGMRTGFKVYNNIIVNAGLGAPDGWWGGKGIASNNKDPVDVYNNVIINSFNDGIVFTIQNPDGPPQGKIYNNIIINPGQRYLAIHGIGDWINFSSDYNLYYPATDFDTDFYFSQAITRDVNSILADPLFVSGSPENAEDFKLQTGSPAIGAGINVGTLFDFEGNPIPQGAGPDIGAYEYTSGIPTPSCTDNIQNQDETDIDCGGAICSDCTNGKNCLINSDCSSNSCVGNVCTAPSSIPTDYIAYWKFDGNANDETGFYDGTLMGNALITDDVEKGQVVSLDGDGDYVDLPKNILAGENMVTLSAWFRIDESTGSILSHYDNGGWYAYYLNVNNNFIEVCISNKSTGDCYQGTWHEEGIPDVGHSNSVNDGLWHHAVVVYDNVEVKLYVDGVLRNSTAKSGAIPTGANYLHSIGLQGYSQTATQRVGAFQGSIDDVMLYNRALTPAEIGAIYTTQSGT